MPSVERICVTPCAGHAGAPVLRGLPIGISTGPCFRRGDRGPGPVRLQAAPRHARLAGCRPWRSSAQASRLASARSRKPLPGPPAPWARGGCAVSLKLRPGRPARDSARRVPVRGGPCSRWNPDNISRSRAAGLTMAAPRLPAFLNPTHSSSPPDRWLATPHAYRLVEVGAAVAGIAPANGQARRRTAQRPDADRPDYLPRRPGACRMPAALRREAPCMRQAPWIASAVDSDG